MIAAEHPLSISAQLWRIVSSNQPPPAPEPEREPMTPRECAIRLSRLKRDAADSNLLAVMRGLESPESAIVLGEMVSTNPDSVSRRLNRLLAEGKVIRHGARGRFFWEVA